MADRKMMDIEEFRAQGYLQEVNRRFFHPLGLALAVSLNRADGTFQLSGVWDDRDDPEGTRYELTAPGASAEECQRRFAHVEAEWRNRMIPRQRALGYVVQPVDEMMVAHGSEES